MKRPTTRMTLFKVLLLAQICILIAGLGEVYNFPSQYELQFIKVNQIIYMTANYSATITYNTSKIGPPTPLLSFDTMQSFHVLAVPSVDGIVQNWFYLQYNNVTQTSIDIYFVIFNQTDPRLQYFTFKVLISCVNTKYLQIVNWQYSGPRRDSTQKFFDLTINPAPDPFKYCFSDAASTVREKINFMLTWNGMVAANFGSFIRNSALYFRTSFHITNSNVSYFNVSMYSDHLSWMDKIYAGLLFICPNSYTLKLKYFAEFKYIGIGTQLQCLPFSTYANSYITLTNNYPYLEILTTRALTPNLNNTDLDTYTYGSNFSLDGSQNAYRKYYQAWVTCGLIDYLVLYITQRYCDGNRTYLESNGTCFCDNSKYFYDNGSVICNFICPIPLINVDFVCYACYQLYGLGCIGCNNLTCTLCDTNFNLSSNNLSCQCSNDRFLSSNLTCILCVDVYDPYCINCDSTSCIACETNFDMINNKCYCNASEKFMFLGMCLLCETFYSTGCISCDQISCNVCDTNWTQNTDGTCSCNLPNYIQSSTGKCINVNSNNSSNNITAQTFIISETHIQLGSSLYIYLSFNQPLNEITQIIPLQSNAIFAQGQSQLTSITWTNNSLNIVVNLNDLPDTTNIQNITMQIINPKYLRWNQLSIQNQLQPMIVQPFLPYSSQPMMILEYLCVLVQWLFPLMILGSWGVFNNGIQLWFLFTFYLYLKPNIYGDTESALVAINKIKFLPFLNISSLLTDLEITYPNINPTEIAMQKNKSLLEMTLAVIILYLASILMCLALRYYVEKKRNNHVIVIYYNVIRYYKEYIYTNFLGIYSFMMLPICVQFQALINSDWNLEKEEVFVNLMVSGVITIIMMMMASIRMWIFPMRKHQSQAQSQAEAPLNQQRQQNHQLLRQQRTYTVSYNKLHPEGMSVLIENYLRVFRAPVFVIMIFVLRDSYEFIAQLALIGYSAMCLLIVIVNYKKSLSRLYWLFCLVKNVGFVGFQIGFLFLPMNYNSSTTAFAQSTIITIVDTVCLWLVIGLVGFEIIEFFAKLVRMFLVNKFDWNEFQVNSSKILPSTQMNDVLFDGDGNYQLHQQLETNKSTFTVGK